MKIKSIFLFVFLSHLACVHENEGLTEFVGSDVLEASIQLADKNEIIMKKEMGLTEILEIEKFKKEKNLSEVNFLLYSLNDCRKYLMDPRLGGASEVSDIPQINMPENEEEGRKELIKNAEGELKIRVTEKYSQILAREKSQNKFLNKRKEIIKKVLNRCKARFSEARVRIGLPAEKYPAKLERTATGSITIIRRAEKNLDDAFEFQRMM